MNNELNKQKFTFLHKWWIYQKERFPIFGHGPLVLSFSFCAASYSSNLRGSLWPDYLPVIVAFFSCLLFFLQLRIADEFKDFEEDKKWRPYRAVPRGLIKLKELGVVFAICGLIQLILAIALKPLLIILLFGAWLYLFSMSLEFGCRKWLKKHPIVYLWSHMLIMPIVDFYATACDWAPHLNQPPSGLLFFLIASFCNGLVIEIGRKIRTPDFEEEGVETYSKLWGTKMAAWIWWIILLITAIFASLAAIQIQVFNISTIIFSLSTSVAFVFVLYFSKNSSEFMAKKFEIIAAIWTIIMYLTLGLLPGLTTNG